MSKKEKLIARFKSMPSDFHYDEMVKLLGYFDFQHKPHPSGILKHYQMKQIREVLGL